LRQPVLVIAPAGWRSLHLGETVRASGRLSPADGDDLGAVYLVHGEPEVLARDGPLLRFAARVREGIRQSVAHRQPEPRALVPALVDGDDAGLPERTATDFRTAGLTHLLAVSGTNLTLVVGALLVLARAVGVRARGLVVVGAVGVLGFVLLARPGAERAAGGGDGLGGPRRHGQQRSAARATGTRACGAGADAVRPVAGRGGRVRAVGAGDRGDRVPGAGLA
jgi:competence protein ComEC